MKNYSFTPMGVCSSQINFDLDNGKIYNLSFRGGCNGNLKAIAKLVDGKDAKEVANILAGNTCGLKQTSCADQLSKAITSALAEN